jgi:hypothetical protein
VSRAELGARVRESRTISLILDTERVRYPLHRDERDESELNRFEPRLLNRLIAKVSCGEAARTPSPCAAAIQALPIRDAVSVSRTEGRTSVRMAMVVHRTHRSRRKPYRATVVEPKGPRFATDYHAAHAGIRTCAEAMQWPPISDQRG